MKGTGCGNYAKCIFYKRKNIIVTNIMMIMSNSTIISLGYHINKQEINA